MRILLVEDEPDTVRMLAKGLREQTYAVDVAADGDVALYQMAINDVRSGPSGCDAPLVKMVLPYAARSAPAVRRCRC